MSGDSSQDTGPVVIIKKKKKRGHSGGHHGGAWKIAYADFVTAMMSFFLVMWLVNSMTAEDKQGVASYFESQSQSGAISGSGGLLGGEVLESEGVLESSSGNAPAMIQDGSSAGEGKVGRDTSLTEEQLQDAEEQAQFEKAQEYLKNKMEAQPEFQQLQDNLKIETTAQGLQIQLVDMSKKPMFQLGSSVILPDMQKLLTAVAQSIRGLPNVIKITGHTDGAQYTSKAYSNWELSADRANATRRLLGQLIGASKIQEVAGKADSDLLMPNDPLSPINRRISILLLREHLRNIGGNKNKKAPSVSSGSNRGASEEAPVSRPLLTE